MSEETLNTEALVEELQVENLVEEPIAEPLSELDQLIAKRMGNFTVNLALNDLKYLRNKLNDVTWNGPNEAYLQIMAVVAISNEIRSFEKGADVNARRQVSLPATTVESINFFLSRVSGKGEEAAHRLFAVSMLLRPTMEEIKNLDSQISIMQNSEKIQQESDK
jgi:hypothetical protein